MPPGCLARLKALRQGIDSRMNEYEKAEYDQEMAGLRSLLAESEFSSLWSDGRSMTMENAIDYALKLIGDGMSWIIFVKLFAHRRCHDDDRRWFCAATGERHRQEE